MKKKKTILKVNKLSFIKECIKIFVMDKKLITTLFLSTFISGFIAHGVGLINKYCFHDDIMFINYHGGTWALGRFTLGVIERIERLFLSIPIFSLQLINGLFTLLFIAFTSYLIIKILNIKNKYLIISIPCLLAVNPSITMTLSYRFTAHVYLLSVFLGTLYIYILAKTKNNYILFILSILNAFNIGIYQGFISFWLSITCLYIIKESYDNKYDIKKTFNLALKFVIYHILSVIMYLIIMKLSLYITHSTLLTYRGLSSLGVTSFSGYINRIMSTYKYYFILPINKSFNMFILNTHILYYILFVIAIYAIIKNNNYKKLSSGTIFSLIFLPLCVHFNIVMAGEQYDLIQAYSVVFQYVILIFFIDRFINIKDVKIIVYSIVVLAMVIYQYIYISNVCYLKAEFLQSQAITYNQTLIARIQSTPNYKINMPVCYINEFNKNTDDVFIKLEFKNIKIHMYSDDDLRNNYAWRQFMANWNGFKPDTVDQSEYENLPIVKSMPCYPDDGSIKVINDVVVVKFSD